MEKKDMTDLIADYLDNTLTKEQKEAFEAKMYASKSFAKEVEEHQLLWEAFQKEEKQLPSKNLEANFQKMLEEEKANQATVVSIATEHKNWGYGIMKIAAGFALLVTLFYLGRYSKEKESQMQVQLAEKESIDAKEMTVLAMMENQSASKRIQGVQYVEQLPSPDPEVIKALAERMQHDENINVRLTALEALSRFSNSKLVKQVFLKTLETEKNPSIQIALIQYLVKIQETKAIEPMKKLLEKEDTQPFIKNEINQALPKII